MESTHFLVRRDRLSEHQTVTEPRRALAPDTAELRVDLFGFSANNVTYGAMGDALSYWKFFPESRPGWGRLPVWGFGTVVRSTAERLTVGERFFGYFPMSSHLVVEPRRIDDAGFTDDAPHRRELDVVYNRYRRTTSDPIYRADTEPHQVVLRPLFITSFLLADYLQEHEFFGAEATLVSSASSKLAWGMAFVLAAGRPAGHEVVGLTSVANVAAVARLGLYDRVVAYGDLAPLPQARRVVLIDIAGDPAGRAAIHRHHGDALAHSLIVGATHWESRRPVEAVPGPAPLAFFAPTRIKQRSQQWTPAGLQSRLAAAWNALLAPVLDPARGWLTIVRSAGAPAIERAYVAMIEGRARADHGHVFTLADGD